MLSNSWECLHLLAKDDRSASMSSLGTKPLSLSGFLFQTKAKVRPRAAPSARILSTRYFPEHTHIYTVKTCDCMIYTHELQQINEFRQKIHKDVKCVRKFVWGLNLDVHILQLQSFGWKSWSPCPVLKRQICRKKSQIIHLFDITKQHTQTCQFLILLPIWSPLISSSSV